MKTKILIVEDEGLIAFGLKKQLEQAGYAVPDIADTAAAALASVERHQPALVMMDIHLRGSEDGISAAEQIRKRFHVPVIFVTAHADSDTLGRAKITEPFGYVVKPFHGVDFCAQIEMALWKHKMEWKLRRSEAWLSKTLQNVADPLIATDSDGNIAFMNEPAAELTGWSCPEAKGRRLLEVLQLFEESTGRPLLHPITYLYDNQKLSRNPRMLKLRKRDCINPILVEAEFSANRDDDGLLLGVIVVFRDTSVRRQAEKENRRWQKMNAVAMMARGLGNDLARLHKSVSASLMPLFASSNGANLRLLEDVRRQFDVQLSLIQELLSLGRAEAGRQVNLNINKVITEMEPMFNRALGIQRSLSLRLQPDIPVINVDQDELRQNLLRLVINARHGIPDKGEVEISTCKISCSLHSKSHDAVQMLIRDNGKRIRADAEDKVFDPYFQSRASGRNPGVALTLVHQFAVLSGGRLEVENAPTAGAAYLLTLPAAAERPLPPNADARAIPVSA